MPVTGVREADVFLLAVHWIFGVEARRIVDGPALPVM